jgi:putative ATPase
MPEGRIPLAQAAVYIATAPKSNAAYLGIDRALEDIRSKEIGKVPTHLRDGSYPGAKNLGNGIGYKYPHDYDGAYIPQQYLPTEFVGKRYYEPTENGYEKEIRKRLQ